jgi:hypothetical protein
LDTDPYTVSKRQGQVKTLMSLIQKKKSVLFSALRSQRPDLISDKV